MRYTSDHKEKTRAKILESAVTLFRRQGFHATGVDKVMAAAGLTPGSFYAHFDSKDTLLAATIEHYANHSGETLLRGLSESAGSDSGSVPTATPGQESAGAMVDRYLAAAHCAHPERGCVVPALAAEVCRAGEAPRRVFEQLIARLIARMDTHLPIGEKGSRESDAEAIAMIALCVGGITLARAVVDPGFSDKILAACRGFAHEFLDHRRAQEPEDKSWTTAR